MSNPQPQYKYYWEDFPVGSTHEYGSVTVSKDDIIAFASQFDPQPFHLDEEAARHSLFGGLCASGWHTCAMAMRMVCDGGLLESASLGSPGVEKLRWLKPVFPGDTLRVHIEILGARPLKSKPDVGLVQKRWDVLNQNDEMVMQLEANSMYRRRPA
jgi:acyl dehydratase